MLLKIVSLTNLCLMKNWLEIRQSVLILLYDQICTCDAVFCFICKHHCYFMKKVSRFVMTTYQSLQIALVSLPFCVLKTQPRGSKCNCSQSTQICDETEVVLQVSKWWLLHVWNSTYTYSCVIFILFLCYIQQLLAASFIFFLLVWSWYNNYILFWMGMPYNICWIAGLLRVLLKTQKVIHIHLINACSSPQKNVWIEITNNLLIFTIFFCILSFPFFYYASLLKLHYQPYKVISRTLIVNVNRLIKGIIIIFIIMKFDMITFDNTNFYT